MKPVAFAVVGLGALLFSAAGPAQVDPLAPLPEAPVRPPPPPPPLLAKPVAAAPRPAGETTRSMGFSAYKQSLAARARAAGVREATIQSVIPALALNARVIQLDRGQPGNVLNPTSTPPFAPYRREHVNSDLIRRGATRYSANYGRLRAIEARSGVEASVLMAIFGHETSYGTVTGGFDLVEALATLAYEGRRRQLFEDEFVAALRLLDSGTPRYRLKGSWAGATGYPQFMPSAVLRLRTDGDGDGRADIWSNESDALASIAAYLRDAGWKPNVHWGVPVRVPASLDRSRIRTAVSSGRCPRVYARHSRWLTVAEWRALGVTPVSRGLPDSEMASLLEPDGRGATAYLLTTNYRSILDYNCSNFYALSVGLLADAIAGG